jgi:hypothetical protein
VCLLLALQWGGTKYPWSDARIIALFVVFGLLIIAFMVIQVLSGERATVPLRIMKNRNIWGCCLFGFSLGAAFFVLVFYLAVSCRLPLKQHPPARLLISSQTWFQAIKGVSAVKSAVMNLPLILSMTVVIILSGVLVSVLGYYVPFMLACSVFMAIGAGLLTTFKPNTSHPACKLFFLWALPLEAF